MSTQTVCGSCTWALFAGPQVANGERYRAAITPTGMDGRAGGTVETGSARPAALSASIPANDDALDRAIEDVGNRPAFRGSPDQAGLAVSMADGKLIVGLADNQRYTAHAADIARTGSAAQVTVRPMKYSTATLQALSDRIAREARELRSGGIRVTSTSVNVLANKVTVEAIPATAATVDALAAEYGPDTLIVRGGQVHTRQAGNNPEGQPAPRIPSSLDMSWYGGIWVGDVPGSGDCTAGYIAVKKTGERYLTTAGHCYTVGTLVFDGAGTQIGRVTEALDGHGDEADGALISLNSPDLATNQIIAQATSVWRNVTDEAERFVPGTRVCFSGAESNQQKCAFNANQGEIIFDDGTVQHDVSIAYNPQFPVDDYAPQGDSGAAVYRSLERDELRVYGITNGSAWYEDDDGTILTGGFYYSFTTNIQEHFGVTALTTPVP
ncbi:hypothetical protein [Spirillospora sp. CA-294931]|uniref:hypothetical protein n=1 Tax=Spirillospora sp. CA-294931 TaxID=3240042 RepID=UPI003D90F852